MKRKIASALIVVMLLSQFSMGFSFAESKQENEYIDNQNTVITENLENSEADAGNTEITDTVNTGEKEEADNRNGDQTTEPAENVKTEESVTKSAVTDIQSTENSDLGDETGTENADLEESVQMQLLSEEPVQPLSSLESQLEKVTEYYSQLGQNTKLSSPLEGVARFAVGERPSLEALKTASQMEAQYHLKYNEISDLTFGDGNSSDTLSETTDGVNAQTWLAQLVLDILAVGGDPADFQGHNYIHELLSSQSAETGFFTNIENNTNPKAADGLALLALNAYWRDAWPSYGEDKGKTVCIDEIMDCIVNKPTLAAANNPANYLLDEQNGFMNAAQWGLSKDFKNITFYNNFWLTQGLSLDSSEESKTDIGKLVTGLPTLKASGKAVYTAQCETMAAYIIAKLSAGQTVSDAEWQKLETFQIKDDQSTYIGQYIRTTSATSPNGEATAMAAIALDYGKRMESDATAKSAFLRLAEANPDADRTFVKEEEEQVFEDVADLKATIDSPDKTLSDIVQLIKDKEDTVSLVSSNEDIVSNEDKVVHPLEAGEPNATVQLKIIIKSGNCATVIRTKKFTIEPEDKNFPFERNIELLKQYYKHYPQDGSTKGINKSQQAYSVASLMNDTNLGGISYNTKFYGDNGYSSYNAIFNEPSVKAILDWIAMNKDPKQYIKEYPSTGLTEEADLIKEILSRQYDNGSFSPPSIDEAARYGYSRDSCVLYTLALESYFGGKEWGSENSGTKYGRIGAIKDILSHMIDVNDDAEVKKCEDINVEGGRVLAYLDANNYDSIGFKVNGGLLSESMEVILFSRWLNDDTEVTVKDGEKKPLKEFAQKEVDGLLKTLKWLSDNESILTRNNYTTIDYAYYISALIASGNKDKVDEYGLWDKLRNARAKDGSYYSSPAQGELIGDNATMAVAMAMGDYQNGKAILTSMTYDASTLSDAEAVQKDIVNIKLPSTATENIALPVKGYYGSTISWESSNPDVINPVTGIVARPEQSQMDAVVSLTATIKRGGASEVKTFLIKIPAKTNVNNENGTADYDALSIPLFVTEDIGLSATGQKGSSIVWESSNPAAITNEGKVTLGDTDTKVTLTATVTNGTFIKVKEFQVTVPKQITDSVLDKAMAQFRSYYNENRNLTGSYWDVFAAKAVLGDSFKDYNFKVFDVKSHKPNATWQGTDYGAVVLQILAQGDNPYDYQGVNYVGKLQNYADENPSWGPFACPIWVGMALDAAGADPTGHKYNRVGATARFLSYLTDLDYGPDMAGWALVPLATSISQGVEVDTDQINTFIETMKNKQEPTGVNTGLFNTYTEPGYVMTLSTGCVACGFSALKNVGASGVDLISDDWKVSGTGPLEAIYNQEIEGKSNVSTQFIIAFGDTYYGDSVWRRVGVKPEQLEEIIKKAEPLVTDGDTKYTVKSFNALKNAYQTALAVKSDANKMKNYYFGQSYFNLRDAIDGLKEKGTAALTIYGQTGNKILDQASISKVGSLLEVLQEAALENGISITSKDNKIAELGGIKADSKGQWYVYKQTSDGDGIRITEPLDQYNVEEGTSLVLKYCEDTSSLSANASLNQHLVYDAAQSLKINGAINAQNEVTGDIVLTNTGLFGTSVTWLPNKLFAIDENGKVTRDAKEDISVVLTAKIYLNGTSTEKQFTVKVKSLNGDSPVTPTVKNAYIRIAGPVGEKWSGKYDKTAIEIESGETAFSLLEKTGASLNVDKNTKYGVYVRGINGLSEFDKGSESGWLYRVNGKFPDHSAALERVYENDYVEWLYTKDLGRDVGGYVAGVGGSVTEKTQKNANSVSVTMPVTASINNATKEAKAVLNAADITKALKEVQDKVKAAQQDGNSDVVSVLRINVSADSQAASVETTIPKASVSSLNNGVDQISIITGIGEVTIDKDIIKALANGITGDLKITIAKTDAGSAIAKISGVTNDVKAKLEGRPIYEFTAQKGDQTVSELGGIAISTVPYSLGTGELSDAVVAYWVKPDGNLEVIKNGHMTDDNKYFTMENNHWSTYAIGYNEVKFTDTASHWAKNNILYLAARDIIRGKGTDVFSPNSQITRSEFVQILANMSGDNLSKYNTSQFADVSENAWYAKAIDWAVENGIAGGTGNDTFSPNANITRQDMSVMISKYAANISKNTLQSTNDEVKFADDYEIASYAKDAVTAMQKAGIINGVKNNLGSYSFNPKSNATRAEATTMIANYMKQ
ncbi:immunoglobulin-like domain-containing protein [Clostridium aminobutyricum]|uniref:S-layer homology domain-containing protein n=1 Tax=Clostridium aminobutyricum TaxID=33953 RepID=A0A939DAN9_CLOAM|nr:immunoglobulin-like domain-containing protein [Clostridium aminobutyricum]MBN7774215.1 S-layer homology domain-containing protein [Clostridium aminobutyricum]